MDGHTRTKGPAAPLGPPGERARTRILDTAEELFAQAGPSAAAALRSIAAAADVNVAAVNYYFGSKEKLFEEMFLRRIAPLNEERLTRLAACVANAGGYPTLEAIIMAFAMPARRLTDEAGASARDDHRAVLAWPGSGSAEGQPNADPLLRSASRSVRDGSATGRFAPGAA